MCKVLKSILIELTNRVKVWSIRKQMMWCYGLGIFVIVSIIIGMIVLNIYLLQQQTVDQVVSTRDDQANEDLLDLAKAGSQFVYSEIYKGSLSMNFLQYMLIDMFREATFALDYSDHQYEFKDINSSDTTKVYERYGNHSVCFKYPTYYYLNESAKDPLDLKKKVSRFVYIFDELLEIYSYSAIRYIMYFEESEFVYFYPGLEIEDYDPRDTIWYQEFLQGETTITTRSYMDEIGNEDNQILSLVMPLYDSYDMKKRIGVVCGDWLIKGLYRLMENIKYLGEGKQFLIYKDGSVVDSLNNPWLDPKIKNLNSLAYHEYWPDVKKKPTGIHYLIEDDEIWRTATSSVVEDPTKEGKDWTFVLILIVKESDVMSYKEEAKNLINDQGTKFVLITVGCSLLTSAVILSFIHCQAQSISRPIQGIIDFTYKLNTEEDDKIEQELHELEEGTDQTAQLVLAYKELARSLINRNDGNIKFENEGFKEYPPNELFRIDKSILLKGIENIPLVFNRK